MRKPLQPRRLLLPRHQHRRKSGPTTTWASFEASPKSRHSPRQTVRLRGSRTNLPVRRASKMRSGIATRSQDSSFRFRRLTARSQIFNQRSMAGPWEIQKLLRGPSEYEGATGERNSSNSRRSVTTSRATSAHFGTRPVTAASLPKHCPKKWRERSARSPPWRNGQRRHYRDYRAAAATSFSIGAPIRLPHSVQEPS
jgi:hypothetical protein